MTDLKIPEWCCSQLRAVDALAYAAMLSFCSEQNYFFGWTQQGAAVLSRLTGLTRNTIRASRERLIELGHLTWCPTLFGALRFVDEGKIFNPHNLWNSEMVLLPKAYAEIPNSKFPSGAKLLLAYLIKVFKLLGGEHAYCRHSASRMALALHCDPDTIGDYTRILDKDGLIYRHKVGGCPTLLKPGPNLPAIPKSKKSRASHSVSKFVLADSG